MPTLPRLVIYYVLSRSPGRFIEGGESTSVFCLVTIKHEVHPSVVVCCNFVTFLSETHSTRSFIESVRISHILFLNLKRNRVCEVE